MQDADSLSLSSGSTLSLALGQLRTRPVMDIHSMIYNINVLFFKNFKCIFIKW